ncbi:MAG: TetR/AcrR family transcriptional regulator [Sciscionella sp.]
MDRNTVREQGASTGERRWSPRQRQLFNEFEALFLEEGFRHLTIADLADRLHCSRRTLYTLAPSREELVLIVIDRLLNRIGANARRVADSCSDPGDAIAAYLEAGVTSLRGARPAFNDDVESYGPTKQLYNRHLRTALDVLASFVDRGIQQGVFRQLNASLVAEILDASVGRIRRQDVLDRTGVSLTEAVEELTSLIRTGLVRPVQRPARNTSARTNAQRSETP